MTIAPKDISKEAYGIVADFLENEAAKPDGYFS